MEKGVILGRVEEYVRGLRDMTVLVRHSGSRSASGFGRAFVYDQACVSFKGSSPLDTVPSSRTHPVQTRPVRDMIVLVFWYFSWKWHARRYSWQGKLCWQTALSLMCSRVSTPVPVVELVCGRNRYCKSLTHNAKTTLAAAWVDGLQSSVHQDFCLVQIQYSMQPARE